MTVEQLFNQLAAELEENKAAMDEYRKAVDELQQRIRQLIDDKPFASDQYVYAYKERNGSVDYKAIPFLQGVDLEPYRKEPVKVWSLTRLH